MNKILIILCCFMLTGCSWFSNKIKDIKGELIGNAFDVSIYDNFGNNILNIDADKVQVDENVVKIKTVDSDGTYSDTYEMSSVLSHTIDGDNMEQVGNSVIYAEEGLKKLVDFELPSQITTSGGSINIIDRNINDIKNKLGTSKVIVVSSQLGVPIAVYGGEKVYYEIPDDLPKMTKINIDGKALYLHRVNYIIIDTNMIK